MFRELRRKNQSLNEKQSIKILKNASSGVLAVYEDGNYPYAIKKNNKVSFCVVDSEEVIPDKFTTDYRSVILFGKARIIEDKEEKAKTIIYLCEKYSPNQKDSWQETIKNSIDKFSMVEIAIEHISGKQSK